MEDELPALLVLVIDANPVWWGQRKISKKEGTLLPSLDAILVFCNSFLMMNAQNKLAVIATHSDKSKFLYHKSEASGDANGGSKVAVDGQYELFTRLDEKIKDELKEFMLDESRQESLLSDCLLAGALGRALCYIRHIERELPVGQAMKSRILVIKGAEDNPAQYMNFMNAVFAAQKHNIVIDACLLDWEKDSSLLYQACDVTGGVYLKLPQLAGLAQYLIWVFLPEPSLRSMLSLPPKAKIDYKAACFCCRKLIDVGYVCSVCLSIYCKFYPFCTTCNTRFKLPDAVKVAGSKVKKTAKIS